MMADRIEDRNDSRRTNGRKMLPQQPPYGSPQPQHPLTHIDYTFDQAFAQQDALTYQNVGGDVPMLDTYNPDAALNGFWMGTSEDNKAGSVTTATTSFVHVGTPSAITDGGNSYQMVRSYSENSNETSGQGSNGSLYSVPDQAEYQFSVVAEFAVDVDKMADEALVDASLMPQDQKLLLNGMYSPEPRTVEDPYQPFPAMPNGDYPESMENYTTQPMQAYQYSLPTRSAKLQNAYEAPWTPVDPQVSGFSPGFVAFAPSPGPAGEQNIEEPCSRASDVPQAPPASKSKNLVKKSHSSKSSAKGKEKASSYGWEHIVIANNGLQRMSENVDREGCHRSGVRRGGLPPEKKEKAKRIRQIGACWDCWIQKTHCTEGAICERCCKLFSPNAGQVCSRDGFKDYETIFFPDYLHAHLRKNAIEKFISENLDGFSNIQLDVDVSTGAVFKPLKLHANVFQAKTWELLRQMRLADETGDQNAQLLKRYSPPVGLLGLFVPELRKKCEKHVGEMVKNPAYAGQTTAGDSTRLPEMILEIVRDYCDAKESSLIRNALKMHAIHYFMSSLMTFSDDSAAEVLQNVEHFEDLEAPMPTAFLSSRLLNRQVKYVMNKLHRDLTANVLEGLERSMRSRTKDSWGASFCTILILCLCMEGLQVAADSFVVCDMQAQGPASEYVRDQSYEACQHLEEYPFYQCKRLFHEIYKSHREGNGAGREAGFNPLKAVGNGNETGLDAATDAMLRRMYGMVWESYPEIVEKSQRLPMINLGDTVDPNDIKANNTGRLASKFLRSFFEIVE